MAFAHSISRLWLAVVKKQRDDKVTVGVGDLRDLLERLDCLEASVSELSAALEAADEKYEAYAVRGDGI